jgi:hypothetical protein
LNLGTDDGDQVPVEEVRMDVTKESLAARFAILSDEELLEELRSRGLTEVAQAVAEEELKRRGLELPQAEVELASPYETAPVAAAPAEPADVPITDDLVMVARFLNPMSGLLLQSRFEAEGVPALVADLLTVQNYNFFAPMIGGVRVMVPEAYLARAREIAAAVERGEYAIDDRADVGAVTPDEAPPV